jgi:hypothetical protein
LELMAYTRGRMAHWLSKHQVPPVLPVVYGKAEDFVLLTPKGGLAADPQPETLAPSAKVNETWETLNKWRLDGTAHKTPRTLQQLELAVTRADRLCSGGGDVGVAETALASRVSSLEAQRAALKLQPYPVASAGRAHRLGIAKESEIGTAMLPFLDLLKPSALKPEEIKGKLQPLFDKPPESSPYDAIVWAVLDAVVTGNDLTPEQLKIYVSALRGLKPPPTHLEISLLAFFADPDLKYRKLWPLGTPRAALRAAIAAEGAAAVEGRALKRIEGALAVADNDFRQALLALFKADQAAWTQAVETLKALPARYEAITQLGSAQEKAIFEWEETVALLPAVGDFAPAEAVARQATDIAWTDLIEKTYRLRQAIEGPADVSSLGRLADDVNYQREKKLVPLLRDVPDGAGPVEIRSRLRLPVWNPADREKWTGRANAAALELAGQALGEAVPATTADLRARPLEAPLAADAAERRTRRAADLLGLAGAAPPLGGGLRSALADGLVARYRKETDPVARERFAWLIHPDDLPATPDTPDGPRNEPTADARRNGEQALARWMVDKRLRPLADELSGQSAETVKALVRDLNEAVRKLNAWRP